MIKRSDILWLGISSAVSGSLVGGLLLGLGLSLAGNGQPIGLFFIIPAAPVAGGIGWLLARRLGEQLKND
jgi:hypothetical protein